VSFWHPLSAVYLEEPPVLASPAILRMILAGEGQARVRYAGDRMWPALRHGQTLQILPLAGRRPAPGEIVLTVDGGLPDLLRVQRAGAMLELGADASDDPVRAVADRDLLGRAVVAVRSGGSAAWRRLRLDLAEAWEGRPEAPADPAGSVRDKYDEQAVHYARVEGPAIEPALAGRIAETVPRGGRLLVAGSGTGREALALEAMGYEVVGVDFSPRMVEIARAAAHERGSRAAFVAADLRRHEEPEASLAGVVFTYDVYSFIPSSAARIEVLARLRRSLVPGGALFLSARCRSGLGDRAILTLQWLAGRSGGRPFAWGDSHTRWLDGSGRLRRSFVHVFTPRALDAELRAAGFAPLGWAGGHGLYR
jgi:SAM-dependent methyltransferase